MNYFKLKPPKMAATRENTVEERETSEMSKVLLGTFRNLKLIYLVNSQVNDPY